MSNKVYTEEQKMAMYGKPIDLQLYSHREPSPVKAKAFYDEMTRLQEIGASLMDSSIGRNREIYRIKTQYFASYIDYLKAQDIVAQQIKYKKDVDTKLEQKLIAETAWLKESKQV